MPTESQIIKVDCEPVKIIILHGMYKITGIIKKEEVKNYQKKDGTTGSKRMVYIEPEGRVFPVIVRIADPDFKIGKTGDKITLDVEIYPYYFLNKERKKGFLDIYIPDPDKE